MNNKEKILIIIVAIISLILVLLTIVNACEEISIMNQQNYLDTVGSIGLLK